MTDRLLLLWVGMPLFGPDTAGGRHLPARKSYPKGVYNSWLCTASCPHGTLYKVSCLQEEE
jgi:hypothetical protein